MPKRASKPCAYPGCGTLTTGRYCKQHEKARLATGYAKGKTTARGYGHRWRQLRDSVLRNEPLCRPCKAAGRVTAATQVDHITAKANGGTDAIDNLQPICEACHRAKTVREAQQGRGGSNP